MNRNYIFLVIIVVLFIILSLILILNSNNDVDVVDDEVQDLEQFRVQKIDLSEIQSNLTYVWERRHDLETTPNEHINVLQFGDGNIVINASVFPDLVDMVHFDDGTQYIRRSDRSRTEQFGNITPSRWGIADDAFRWSSDINSITVMQGNVNVQGKQLYIINNLYTIERFYNQIRPLKDSSYNKVTKKRSVLIYPGENVRFEGSKIDIDNEIVPVLYPGDGMLLTLIAKNRWRITRFFNNRDLITRGFLNEPQFNSSTSTLRTQKRR